MEFSSKKVRNPIRVAVVADLHTSISGKTSHGVDVKANFLRVFEDIKSVDPDYIWIGGDLCLKEPQLEIYQWQHSLLEDMNIPYRIIAGNHDDSHMLTSVFRRQSVHMHGDEMYWTEVLPNDRRVIFLDSSRGELSADQKRWLTEMADCREPAMILMHHPPTTMHVPYMDLNHRLRDHAEVMDVLHKFKVPPYILCGHYHIDKTVMIGAMTIRILPSCYFQLRGDIQDFGVDHHYIGYAILEIYTDRIETRVKYLYEDRPAHQNESVDSLKASE